MVKETHHPLNWLPIVRFSRSSQFLSEEASNGHDSKQEGQRGILLLARLSTKTTEGRGESISTQYMSDVSIHV